MNFYKGGGYKCGTSSSRRSTTKQKESKTMSKHNELSLIHIEESEDELKLAKAMTYTNVKDPNIFLNP